MAALGLPDGTLAGVLSRWSIIHTPPPELPALLAEFARVLAPGGHLLLAFWATEDPSVPTQSFDHTVTLAHRWSPDHLAALLGDNGLTELSRTIQRPRPTDRRQFDSVHLLARRAPSA
jgi:SAM-dependent methyltransferase